MYNWFRNQIELDEERQSIKRTWLDDIGHSLILESDQIKKIGQTLPISTFCVVIGHFWMNSIDFWNSCYCWLWWKLSRAWIKFDVKVKLMTFWFISNESLNWHWQNEKPIFTIKDLRRNGLFFLLEYANFSHTCVTLLNQI